MREKLVGISAALLVLAASSTLKAQALPDKTVQSLESAIAETIRCVASRNSGEQGL